MSNKNAENVWRLEEFPPELHIYPLGENSETFGIDFNGLQIGEGDIISYNEHLGTPNERLVVFIETIGWPQSWGDWQPDSPEERAGYLQHIVSSLMRKANELYPQARVIEIDSTDAPEILDALAVLGSPDRWSRMETERDRLTAFERNIPEAEAVQVGITVMDATVQVATA